MNVPNILVKQNPKLNRSILEIIIIIFLSKNRPRCKTNQDLVKYLKYLIGFQLTIRDFSHYIINKMRYFIGHVFNLYGSVEPT